MIPFPESAETHNRQPGLLTPLATPFSNHENAGGRVLVLGIGNSLLSDEGVGVHVVTRLAGESGHVPGVQFADGGTLGLLLAPMIEAAASVIFVDASEMASAPGTVRAFEGADMDRFIGSNRKRSAHEVGLLDLIALAALAGRLPERRALIGIQPQSIGWGAQLTDPVAASVDAACELARELIERWR